jgi:hypothetical protein
MIVACTDDIGLPIGTADLAFDVSGGDTSSATVAWAIARPASTTGYAGWTLLFAGSGSAATSCNDSSATPELAVDIWVDGATTSSPSGLPAGVYRDLLGSACGSDAMCAATDLGSDVIYFDEVELLDSDLHHLRGSLMGSGTATGSGSAGDSELVFYGSFDAQTCGD